MRTQLPPLLQIAKANEYKQDLQASPLLQTFLLLCTRTVHRCPSFFSCLFVLWDFLCGCERPLTWLQENIIDCLGN